MYKSSLEKWTCTEGSYNTISIAQVSNMLYCRNHWTHLDFFFFQKEPGRHSKNCRYNNILRCDLFHILTGPRIWVSISCDFYYYCNIKLPTYDAHMPSISIKDSQSIEDLVNKFLSGDVSKYLTVRNQGFKYYSKYYAVTIPIWKCMYVQAEVRTVFTYLHFGVFFIHPYHGELPDIFIHREMMRQIQSSPYHR